MTLLELERSLPNGFHDAHIHSFSVDYVKREATITLDVLFGIPEGKTEFEREAYRSCLLKLTGLEYFIIDLPDSTSKFAKPGTLWIDAGPLESAKLKSDVRLLHFNLRMPSHISFSCRTGIHLFMLQLLIQVWNGNLNHFCLQGYMNEDEYRKRYNSLEVPYLPGRFRYARWWRLFSMQ